MKKLAAEFIGTFALVFAGTGAIVIDETTGGAVTHVGVALTFGLIVLAMIYTVGDISGAHLNPAVSLGFLAARRFPLRQAVPYIASSVLRSLGSQWSIAPSLSAKRDAGHDNSRGLSNPVICSRADFDCDFDVCDP